MSVHCNQANLLALSVLFKNGRPIESALTLSEGAAIFAINPVLFSNNSPASSGTLNCGGFLMGAGNPGGGLKVISSTRGTSNSPLRCF